MSTSMSRNNPPKREDYSNKASYEYAMRQYNERYPTPKDGALNWNQTKRWDGTKWNDVNVINRGQRAKLSGKTVYADGQGNWRSLAGLDVIGSRQSEGQILGTYNVKTKTAPKTPGFQDDPALAALIPDRPQQERDSEGLTPMQQWAKKYKDTLAPKVKEGQSGFKEIDAYFKAQDMSIDEPGGRITPVEMLQKMSGGQEVVIGPDGISDPTPIKPEIASTPRQKDTPDINNPVPASKEKADQYLQSFLPGTPTLTTSFNQSQGNLPVSDYLSTDKLVGANYMRFGEDPEVTKAVFNLNPELETDYARGYSRDYNAYRFVD